MTFSTLISRIVMGAILALMTPGCSETEQRGSSDKKQAAKDDDKADGEDSGDSEGDGTKPADEQGESEGEEDGDLAQILSDCGGKDAADAGPNDVIYKKTLSSLPIVTTVLTGSLIKVTVVTMLDIKVTGSKTTQDAKVTVTAVEGLLSGLAKGKAAAKAAANSGVTTLTNVPISEYSGLGEHKVYEGIVCTIVPATKVDNRRGTRRTVAEFDPPIPSSISPRAIAARYKDELGDSKVFDGIKATIIQTDDPDLKGESSITGQVAIEKVAPSAQLDDGAGGTMTVKGDLAYKVTYNFRDPKATYALGFPPTVTYYISHKKKDLAANVVDTSEVEGALAVFVHP